MVSWLVIFHVRKLKFWKLLRKFVPHMSDLSIYQSLQNLYLNIKYYIKVLFSFSEQKPYFPQPVLLNIKLNLKK